MHLHMQGHDASDVESEYQLNFKHAQVFTAA